MNTHTYIPPQYYVNHASEKINWLNVKEILTCHEVHNISWVEGVTAEDVDKVTEITGWGWGVLYKVGRDNRFAHTYIYYHSFKNG